MKKNLLVSLFSVFLVLSCPFIIMKINDIHLNIFSQQLFNHELPPNTEVILKHKESGNMNGTGDNFGYWVYMIIRTDLSEQEIQKYYHSAGLKGSQNMRLDIIPYNLAKQGILRIYFREIESSVQLDDKYIIQLYDSEDSILGWFDIRRS